MANRVVEGIGTLLAIIQRAEMAVKVETANNLNIIRDYAIKFVPMIKLYG